MKRLQIMIEEELDEENVQQRMKYMRDNEPSSTVICCQLLESR